MLGRGRHHRVGRHLEEDRWSMGGKLAVDSFQADNIGFAAARWYVTLKCSAMRHLLIMLLQCQVPSTLGEFLPMNSSYFAF